MCTGRLSLTRSASSSSPSRPMPSRREEVGGGVLDLALLEHRDPDPLLAEHRAPAAEQPLVVEPVEVLERGEEGLRIHPRLPPVERPLHVLVVPGHQPVVLAAQVEDRPRSRSRAATAASQPRSSWIAKSSPERITGAAPAARAASTSGEHLARAALAAEERPGERLVVLPLARIGDALRPRARARFRASVRCRLVVPVRWMPAWRTSLTVGSRPEARRGSCSGVTSIPKGSNKSDCSRRNAGHTYYPGNETSLGDEAHEGRSERCLRRRSH